MSGSTIASGALPSLLSAAEAFIDATVVDGGSHRVGIQLFDGRQFPVDVIEYTNDVVDLQAAIDGLSGYVVVDSSTNLNGAVIAGLADVDAKLAASQAGAKSSALVVFTDGTDQTSYFTTDQAVMAVNASPSAVFTVGLGAELDANALRRIGKSGAEFAAEQADIVTAFTAIGAALEREAGGYYILSYCSPKRAGSHTLTVAVDGRPGQASYTFNATGFSGGCTPEGVSDPCANRACGVVDGIVCGACSGEATCTLAGECLVSPSDICGDGSRTANEACDDGDTDGGDGCNANCTAVEGGFTCPALGGACSAICGDGLKRGNEACDDGNTSNTDRCSQCECIRGYVEDGNGGCISDPDTEPDWTLVLTAPLIPEIT
jgi:cysteine-rich repeat protein